jgi:hypothetical protein
MARIHTKMAQIRIKNTQIITNPENRCRGEGVAEKNRQKWAKWANNGLKTVKMGLKTA